MKLLTIDKQNLQEILDKYYLYLFKIRNSRLKAKPLAIMETFLLLKEFECVVIKNSPMGDIKGVFCVAIKKEFSKLAELKFDKLGYSNKVMFLNFENASEQNDSGLISINPLAIKGKVFDVQTVYVEDCEIFVKEAADRRKFLLLDEDGNVKEVKGYRGDGTKTGKRALPVEDCRLLVNLAGVGANQSILDPFAGGGGIIYQARKTTKNLFSNDIDFKLSEGLKNYGAIHSVKDVKNLVLKEKSIDAIVTEVPFDESCNSSIVEFLNRSYDYLTDDGKIVVMVSRIQADYLNKFIDKKLHKFLEFELNRKGTDVTVFAYAKNKKDYIELDDVFNQIKTIF